MKSLRASKVHFIHSQNKVYVNEHLFAKIKLFLTKLKQKCKDVNY